jgi:hypothetical protein
MPDKPRISINQLAKYLAANATMRRRIIIEQKQPKTFMINYYDYAQKPIIEFLLGGCKNEEIIVKEIDALYSKDAQSEYDETRLNVNAEALQAFLDSYEKLDLDGLRVKRIQNDCPKIKISGVDISVRPEVLISGHYKGKYIIGAIKLYYGKNDPLSDDSASYISAVVSRLVEKHFTKKYEVSNRHCRVYDIFGGTVYVAPTSTIKRFRDVKYACQEIALRWNALEEEE